MSDLWVAVTAEYQGTTFSHRATTDRLTADTAVLHTYERKLAEAGYIVLRGLRGWLPAQQPAPMSDYQKIAAIERVVENVNNRDVLAPIGLRTIGEILDQ